MWTLNYLAVSYLFERLADYNGAVEYLERHRTNVEQIFFSDKKILATNVAEIDDVFKRLEIKLSKKIGSQADFTI